MSALAHAELTRPADVPPRDYDVISRVIETLSTDWREQPSLDDLSRTAGMNPIELQKLFTRWAGLSPKAFLQALTLDHAKKLLGQGMPILDASLELGLSGPGRLHDLFVTHEAMSPGDFKTGGEGLLIRYGFHDSPFGRALAMITDRGLCGLAFSDGDDEAALKDMTRRWPFATYARREEDVLPFVQRIFDPARWKSDEPLRIVMIGTDFQVRVWEALLKIPMGSACRYGDLARDIGKDKASRAVGADVGANPLSFVVPCHRAVGSTGALAGYHWGLTRKRAILGWEAGQTAQN